ncbi:35909_t:CDS:2 [Racocetra persica]|uniref:35909_t:CDS:1 n=1 Tax=Racocetra persica TaxID=160502 RepID=A0ACA9N9W0_9GLOM|nr:35909_t:CDS:2 [Racocetra persica]
MSQKNLGPCSVCNCQIEPNQYRRITEYALKKVKEKGTFDQYNYLEVGKQLYYPHYLEIVKPDRHNKLLISINKQNNIVVKKLLSFELNPDQFQKMLEDAEPQLVGFFNELYDVFIPER